MTQRSQALTHERGRPDVKMGVLNYEDLCPLLP
jgi:hypothetical protein